MASLGEKRLIFNKTIKFYCKYTGIYLQYSAAFQSTSSKSENETLKNFSVAVPSECSTLDEFPSHKHRKALKSTSRAETLLGKTKNLCHSRLFLRIIDLAVGL